ncbi:hypothetical protein QTP88_006019 [Uroleucon formosanum]
MSSNWNHISPVLLNFKSGVLNKTRNSTIVHIILTVTTNSFSVSCLYPLVFVLFMGLSAVISLDLKYAQRLQQTDEARSFIHFSIQISKQFHNSIILMKDYNNMIELIIIWETKKKITRVNLRKVTVFGIDFHFLFEIIHPNTYSPRRITSILCENFEIFCTAVIAECIYLQKVVKPRAVSYLDAYINLYVSKMRVITKIIVMRY